MNYVYAKNNSIKAEAGKFEYSGTFLGECYISANIESEKPIEFEIGDYLFFRDERFVLNYIPAKQKQARKNSNGAAFVYEGIKFNSLADELTRVEFLDVVLSDNKIHYSSISDFSFYASSVKDLADRIQANMNRVFSGTEKWTIEISPDLISPDKNVVVSKINCWDALALAVSEFGANFIIRNRTITIGTAGIAVGNVFGYGKGNGLYDIQQTTNQDALIITRLRAYGNTRNIPHKYYNKLTNNKAKPYISESVYIPNLMLPQFPYTISDPSKVYIDSPNIEKYGLRESSVYFDGNNDLQDIYPSLEGMTKKILNDAGITVKLPTNDNGNIDEIYSVVNPTDDGTIPEEGSGVEMSEAFTISLKDLGFDLSEKDSDGQYKYATSDTMQISMKSGMCIGRTFDVIENGITKENSSDKIVYKIRCKRFTDDTIAGGTAFPNSKYQVKAGDKFVILGISMPEVYVKAAATRLEKAAKEYLLLHDETKYTYSPKIDEIFMANNPEIGETIKEGDIFNFNDTDLSIDGSVIIQSLKINVGDKLIPTYEITLSNDRIVGTMEKMQNAISSLVSNATGITIEQVKSLISSIGSSLFLSKRFEDIAQGLIKFVNGLNVGDYSSGAFGSGGTLRMNEGDSYLEVDKLFVRKWAKFTELLVERLSHIGGSLVISPARMVCNKVDELENVYRCYFDKGEGEVIQEFVKGDQARCQVFNGSTQKYYWRLVTNVGNDYIDLSKSDMDGGSGVPESGDHIVQFGHRDNPERQNLQILSAYGNDAPSYKQYQGVNSFSLEGKEKTVLSPNGNIFDGRVKIAPNSTGWENLTGLPEEFQDLSTGAVNLIRNSGFTGDYETKSLSPDSYLREKTEMYSEPLKYWNGDGVVNKDSESKSGFSVTLFNQTISQPISTLVPNENYIISLKAKGTSLTMEIGGLRETIPFTSTYSRYINKFVAVGGSSIKITGHCTLCEIQLERGKITSDWSASPLDNNKSLAQYQAMRYLSDSIKNGSTTILGGLILSSIIQLGNYVNGEMKTVTSGMSGVYNDESDVALWSGGDLQKAIYTAMNPFSTEADKIINFLVTHGGLLIANNAIIRGTIYANDGEFNGTVKIAGGKILLNKDGSGQLADGNIKWDATGKPVFNGVVTSTDDDGNIIEIKASTKRINLKNKYGDIMGHWVYTNPDREDWTFYESQMKLIRYEMLNGKTRKDRETYISPEGITFTIEGYNGESARYYFCRYNHLEIERSVIFKNLPTKSDYNNLSSGQLYRDGENLKIKA